MVNGGCSGPCEQGKKPCPTPEACRVPDEGQKMYWEDVTIAVGLTAFVLFLIFVVGGV